MHSFPSSTQNLWFRLRASSGTIMTKYKFLVLPNAFKNKKILVGMTCKVVAIQLHLQPLVSSTTISFHRTHILHYSHIEILIRCQSPPIVCTFTIYWAISEHWTLCPTPHFMSMTILWERKDCGFYQRVLQKLNSLPKNISVNAVYKFKSSSVSTSKGYVLHL